MTTEITAGPAADAKIAEAMGWTQFGPCTGLHWKNAAGEVVRDGTALGFTTTGDGMLEMLEWMRAKQWATALESPDDRDEMALPMLEWQCHIFINGIERTYCEAADTAPLAVAKALLAAVEESRDG